LAQTDHPLLPHCLLGEVAIEPPRRNVFAPTGGRQVPNGAHGYVIDVDIFRGTVVEADRG
jgi:hypothetical protein